MEYCASVAAVCDAFDIKLTEIDDWNCCGGAAAKCMSRLLGLFLPARNVAKAQERGLPLAIPCPGCFNAVKRAQHALTNDPEMKEQLESIIGFQYKGDLQVQAMHNVFLDLVGIERMKAAVVKPLAGLKVASYYGCALVRDPDVVHQGPHENPVFLDALVSALGAEPTDWSYKTDCCGADLAMTHGKMTVALNDRLAWWALEAGADCVMCCCGLCQVNLDMKQSGDNEAKIPVFYFTELMGIAMDLPGREEWWDKHIVDVRPVLRARGLL
jgi:heterodisulfide reductase subunit B